MDDPPKPGEVGSYNQAWFDSGTKVVGTRQTSLVVDPPDGRVPLTPAAEAKRDYNVAHNADSYVYMSVWDRCITRGVPAGMFPAGYNNAYQILQTPGYVVILYEMIHETRIIPLDGRPHVARRHPPVERRLARPLGRQHAGGGHDQLQRQRLDRHQRRHRRASRASRRAKSLHVVERFTRSDPDTISYEVTIDDPTMYTRPWKVAIPLTRNDNYRIYEYACHEGNHAVENVLSAGRAAEKAAEAK